MLNIIVAVLIFGLIILIHEFGHFIFAKLGGIGVTEFSIGMGPRLFSFVHGDTRYSLKLLPFGGSCAMVGEDTDDNGDRSFNSKPVLVRILVIAAGPGFNFILAFLAAMIIVGMVGHDGTVISGVLEGYPAEEAGLQAGDRITKINTLPVEAHRDISMYLLAHPGREVTIYYDRPSGGEWEKDTTYERRQATFEPLYDEEYQSYMIGVIFPGYEKPKGIGEFLGDSLYEVKYYIVSTIESIAMLIRRDVKASEAVAGPIQIVSMVGETVGAGRESGLESLIYVIAQWVLLLSASLGIMNLLPIPALDGGRLLFLIIELIRGKPIDPEKEGFINMIGLAALMVLMFVILFNDVFRLLF